MLSALAIIAVSSLHLPHSRAALLFDIPVVQRQPDGTELRLLASGDEYYNRLHDDRGFTIVRHPRSGDLVYARAEAGRLVPTSLVVGRDDPLAGGLRPGLMDDPAIYLERVRARLPVGPVRQPGATKRGTLNNIVLFIRFADEDEFQTPLSVYEGYFNRDEPGHPSLRTYFREATYGSLEVVSHWFPIPDGDMIVSFQSEEPRAYYQPYHATMNPIGYGTEYIAGFREQTLVKKALMAISPDIPPGLDLDGDGDGTVDNVVVVVKGGPDAWADLLWPHQTVLMMDLAKIGELFVLTYNFQLEDHLLDRSSVGVLAHELFHSLGAPDLYHYNHDGFSPAGPWDLMEWNAPIPQHMNAYMKYRYGGWIETIPELPGSGTYTLNPLASPTNNAFKVTIPWDPKQFFVLEYRRAHGVFESSLPGSGLLVWRIDSRRWGNHSGPPDEAYVLRPGGTPSRNGSVRRAHFLPSEGRDVLDLNTSPYPFLQDGTPVDFRVSNITEPGETITFTACLAFRACWQKECGDDTCGGTCGTCALDRLCEGGLCVAEQRCDTYSDCLAGCDGPACHDACGIVPVACPGPNDCQEPGSCDTTLGRCVYPSFPDGTGCNDGNACTRVDICIDGTCAGEDPVQCPAALGCFGAGVCNTQDGSCRIEALPKGDPCDDGDACTANDRCNGKGLCISDAYECPALPCYRFNRCDGHGNCTPVPDPVGVLCDDGDICTRDDRCDGTGNCAGKALECPAGPCHQAGTCGANGECVRALRPAGTPCDDGSDCSLDDRCDEHGACRGTPDPACSPGNGDDTVDPSTEPIPDTRDPSSSTCSASPFRTVPVFPSGLALLFIAMAAAIRIRRPGTRRMPR
jgi:M6 family metalloprotease-like protein